MRFRRLPSASAESARSAARPPRGRPLRRSRLNWGSGGPGRERWRTASRPATPRRFASASVCFPGTFLAFRPAGDSAMPNTGDGHSNGTGALPERLRARLARAEDGVWVTTTDGRIVFWNRAAQTSLGFRAREVCGRRCAEILTAFDERGRPICGPGCDAVDGIAKGVGPNFGIPTHTRDGRDVWLEVMTFMTNGNESPLFIIHVFHDATRTKHLLRDLREHIDHPLGDAERLTPREREVLRLMAEGLGTAATADRLRVSRATVRNHVQNIFGKLGVHTRLEAVAHARRHRLL